MDGVSGSEAGSVESLGVQEAVDEAWLSTLDTVLLGALVTVVLWYYFKGRGDADDAAPPANIHIR